MKKVELLSPVGNFEMLKQAIHNGADAVYLSGKDYGARKFAGNFTKAELVEAIQYAHLYGVKVYVTVNTLIYEEELEDILSYVEFLHRNNVDALIMQDIGLIKVVHTTFPNLEIHASTQCHTTNQDAVSFLQKLGVQRVVLAREMSLTEINNIKTPIEKEVFVYGALCVCYSGCCLFSSLNGGRSGNRGECVGSCRLPYKLIKNNEVIKTKGNYLLSTKELNTLGSLKEILDSGIDSLKIEGRMKSPAYVGYVTKLYRKLIDCYYAGTPLQLTKEEITNLKKLYNRSFTKGYLFQESDIMNIETPNHQGIKIGKVLSSTKNRIQIKLTNDSLSQNDGIRFQEQDVGNRINRLYNRKGLLVNHLEQGEIGYIENRFQVQPGTTILKTMDSRLVQELEQIPTKKIPITMEFIAHPNTPMTLTLNDNQNTITVTSTPPELAQKRETTEEEITRQLRKLGQTPFAAENITIQKSSQLFINIKELNQLRREATEQLIEKRKNYSRPFIKNHYQETPIHSQIEEGIEINVLVRTEEQLKCCLAHHIHTIYTPDYSLYKAYKHLPNLYYRTPRVNSTRENFHNEKLLVGELGSIEHNQKDNTLVGDYYLNVTNHNSINLLWNKGLKRITLSVELNDTQIKNIMRKPYPVELIIYGRLELMVMKYCPLKKNLNYCNQCQNKQDKFYLEDTTHNRYPFIRENCLTHILQAKPIDRITSLSNYLTWGIHHFRIELFEEDYNEVEAILTRLAL